MSANQNAKTKQYRPAVEEEVVEETPLGTPNTQNSSNVQNKTLPGYESLYAPTGMTNDAMSGWRNQLGAMNTQYGGDILNYANMPEFNTLDPTKQNQYYTDLKNYNALYNTVANYDTDFMNQEKAAQDAEAYANTKRMLMQRYLPETLAAMGYSNTGAASDALLKMNNAYDNYAMNAKATASQNQTDLMSKYRNEAMAWQEERNNEKIAENEAKQTLYNEYLANILNGGALDKEGIETAVQLGALTPQQRDELYARVVTNVKDIPVAQNTANKTYNIIYPGETAAEVRKKFNVKVNSSGSNKQDKFVQDVLDASNEWGEEMSGTLVDFNYGRSKTDKSEDATSVYVFYWNPYTNKGEWRLTELDRNEARIRAINNGVKYYEGGAAGGTLDFYSSTLYKGNQSKE